MKFDLDTDENECGSLETSSTDDMSSLSIALTELFMEQSLFAPDEEIEVKKIQCDGFFTATFTMPHSGQNNLVPEFKSKLEDASLDWKGQSMTFAEVKLVSGTAKDTSSCNTPVHAIWIFTSIFPFVFKFLNEKT